MLRVKTTKAFGESTAAKILDLVENAAASKSRSESFITKFARIYTPIVVGLAVLVAVLPGLITGEWATWIYRGLLFLVVSCPCALVISVPLTFFGGLGGASKKGILIKGSNLMDQLSKLQTVVFDKTGTLTEGVFEVSAVHPEKTSSPIDTRFSDSFTSERLVHFMNASSSMFRTESGIEMDVRLSQLLNAVLPMLVTPLPIVISSKAVHL